MKAIKSSNLFDQSDFSVTIGGMDVFEAYYFGLL